MKISYFSTFKVSTQLIWLFTISILAMASYFYIFSNKIHKETFKEGFEKSAEAKLNFAVFGLEYGLIEENYSMIDKVKMWLVKDNEIKFFVIVEKHENSNEVFLSYPSELDYNFEKLKDLSEHKTLNKGISVRNRKFSTKLSDGTPFEGEIFLGFDTEKLIQQREDTAKDFGVRTLLILLGGIGLAIFISRYMTVPLKILSDTARSISYGQTSLRANNLKGGREIRELANSFNNMLQALEDRNVKLQTTLDDLNEEIRVKESFQMKILESEEKFRSLTESATDAIIITDAEGNITFWNKSAQKIFKYSDAEVQNTNIKKYFNEESLSLLHNEKNHKLANSLPFIGHTAELVAITKDKKNVTVELSLSAVRIRNNSSAIAIVRDITERKHMEMALQKAKIEAEKANRAKSEFLANMSHEIRTPMNSILGFSQLLIGKLENPQLNSYIEAISSSGKSLLGLINDILDLSKIEAGKLELEYDAVNPHSIFEEVKQIFAFKVKEKGLDLILHVDETIPKGLVLDEIRLRQVMVNLVGNAVKFTESGQITIAAEAEEHEEDTSKMNLIFSVRDTGIGISEEQQQLIFEAFRQQAGQSTRKYGGTGLGLAITKRLVEMMNGNISVESNEGNGSIFRVKLYDIDIASTIAFDKEDSSLETKISLKDLKILIVDDIELNRKLVREYLGDNNLDIYEAEDGKQAIYIAEEIIPDLILMDMKMPVMDGYEATRRIVSMQKLSHIPIIALTASAMKGDEDKILNIGCKAYLPKPVDKFALLNQISKLVGTNNVIRNDNREIVNNDFNQNDIDYIINGDIQQFLDYFDKELLPIAKKYEHRFVMGQIETFTDMLNKASIEFDAEFLAYFANKLKVMSSAFDLQGIKKIFAQIIRIPENFEGTNNG